MTSDATEVLGVCDSIGQLGVVLLEALYLDATGWM
jgi:hypothetical protein